MDKILLLNNWFVANKLSLSLDKTCYTIFGASDADKAKINFKIDNVILQKVNCTKYLGIFIDSNLSWENNIDYIYNKIIKFVGIFYKIQYKLNFEISKMIYCAFIHSHLIYGIEIYGNTYTKYLNKLMILNNKILRILQHAPLDTPVSQLYATFHTIPIHCLTYIIYKF